MTTTIRSANDGSYGAMQVGGVDKLLLDPTGLDSGVSIGASVSGNALTLTLNPCSLRFRSPTLGSGGVNCRAITSQLSLTVSSGSTLGTVSGQASRLVLLALDNAGTVELAVVNIAGGNKLDESNLISTTAEGGAGGADSASVIYSAIARTSRPYRVLGYIESTQVTAGTWATAPSTIQGCGGQALAAMSSLGYGQTWQSFSTAARSLGTTFYNTTGKPIMVYCRATSDGSNSIQILIGGITFRGSVASNSNQSTIFAIVPPGASYVIALAGGSYLECAELR